jgi:hypothetical protein
VRAGDLAGRHTEALSAPLRPVAIVGRYNRSIRPRRRD